MLEAYVLGRWWVISLKNELLPYDLSLTHFLLLIYFSQQLVLHINNFRWYRKSFKSLIFSFIPDFLRGLFILDKNKFSRTIGRRSGTDGDGIYKLE